MNMNKNKNRSKRKTLKHINSINSINNINSKKKRRNYTQKHSQIGGTKKTVCEELPDLKQNNIFSIFKYDIQLPKITK
jgi:hypothetical protein